MLPKEIMFTKLNSAGNDFICLDNTSSLFSSMFEDGNVTAAFARSLCRRGLAVGADGLIVANRIDDGDADTIIARFLEPDGSEARLCGNGTACFAFWAIARGLVPGPEVQVITQAGTARGRLMEDKGRGDVQVCIPDPTDLKHEVQLEIEGGTWEMATVDMGVPHAIVYVDDISKVDVSYWGGMIRRHPRFQPEGINVNFVQILEKGNLAVRTFEFGVEGETLACGTGSAASAIVACLQKKWGDDFQDCRKSIKVRTRSGKILTIGFKLDVNGQINNVCMESTVCPVYEATLCREMHQELESAVLAAADKNAVREVCRR